MAATPHNSSRSSSSSGSGRHHVKKASIDSYSTTAAHVECLRGPILFSAPHGLPVYRGTLPGERRRLHLREKYSSELAVLLADAVNAYLGFKGSFLIWNMKTAKEGDVNNLDPNYLVASQFSECPWHTSLLRFQEAFSHAPILHVDVHGKKNRKTNRDLDIGLEPMHQIWPNLRVPQAMAFFLEHHFMASFEGCPTFKGMRFSVEVNPELHGYWGENTHTTLSHQSVLLGAPALQLEIPFDMRRELMRDSEFLHRFAGAIAKMYVAIIVPLYDKRFEELDPESEPDEGRQELFASATGDWALFTIPRQRPKGPLPKNDPDTTEILADIAALDARKVHVQI